MAQRTINCDLHLAPDDFIMRDHRVHGVSVLPGAAFLDIVHRIIEAQGFDGAGCELRDIVFAEAVATDPGTGRDIRVTLTERTDGDWDVTARSRAAVPDDPPPWRDNFSGRLTWTTAGPAPAVDLDALRAGAVKQRDLAELYAQARAEQIQHGPAMACSGAMWEGPGYLLAELNLSPRSQELEDGFHLHPAKLDAATLVAFGMTGSTGDPFIPMFIERFRANRRLRGRCYAYLPAPETAAASGQLVSSDCLIFDEQGYPVAEFTGLTCKRIRFPEQVTALVAAPAPASVPAAAEHPADAPATEPTDPAGEEPPAAPAGDGHVVLLRGLVAGALGVTADEVDTRTGFYTLGLDSVALLKLGQDLEQLIGERLYPTLLFEYGTVDELARHLAQTHPQLPAATGPTGPGPAPAAASPATPTATVTAEPAGTAATAPGTPRPAVVACRPVWHPMDPVPGPDQEMAGDVLLLGAAPELAAGLRARMPAGRRLIVVGTGPGFAADGPDSYRLDPRSRDQWTTLLDRLVDEGTDTAAFIQMLPDDPPRGDRDAFDTVRALAAALASRPLPTPVGVHQIYRSGHSTPSPQYAALAALCRTLTAEVPRVRCRAVELDLPAGAEDLLTVAAGGISGPHEPHLRYAAGSPYVLRHTRVALPAHADPPGPSSSVYLITGAGGGIATLLAERLAREPGVGLLLLGHRPADPGLRHRIDGWERLGARVHHVRADLAREDEVRAAVAEGVARFGRIDRVLHCAGAADDGVFFREEAGRTDRVLAPKTAGLLALDAATEDLELDWFVTFSSLASVVPSPGQSTYAYANSFMDHFANRRTGRTLSVAWPHWADGGMSVPPEAVESARAEFGLSPMPAVDGLRTLWSALASGERRIVVGHGEAERIDTALHLVEPPEPGDRTRPEARPTTRDRVGPMDTGRPAEDADAATDEIAVIGVAGRYPQADSLDAFWDNLRSGRDSVTEIPVDRWDKEALYDPEKGRPGRTYGRWGGFLSSVDRFDPAFFGISRKEAEWMDPQERLFLTTAWHTLEDAGYPPDALREETVGVFLGIMWNHYQLVTDGAGGVAPTALHSSAANRVSFALDLSGPSIALDTACSSSLTALHLAVESIRRGESTLALAGGVNVMVHPQKYLQLAQGRWLSEDGRCRSFGEGGTGYVPGEGVGAVLLKPLSRARADGDHIHAVIKGTGVNHSGRTSGFTVPSPAGQAELIRHSLASSGIDPATVGYVEAHGTGTSLGDPIEIEGLGRGFGDRAPARCPIGSVKSNIGHLESAAGIAALTKVLLQLKHRTLVPSLHAGTLNPQIDFDRSPFRVQRTTTDWAVPDGTPRRAVISAFGAGGANAHAVVEEYLPTPRAAVPAGPQRVTLSARTEDALLDQVRALDSHLASLDLPGTDQGRYLADLAHTLRVGRASMVCRASVVVDSLAELRRALARILDGEDREARETADAPATPGDRGDVRRIPLPGYPFQEERCWLGAWERAHDPSRQDAAAAIAPPVAAAPRTAPDRPTGNGGVELRVLDHGVGLVVLGAPMFTDRLLRELADAFAEIDTSDDIRAVVITGSNTIFSMGATPKALEELARGEGSFTDEPVVYGALTGCRKPVVAALQGHASGGGFTFGMYGDVVLLSADSSYSANFLKYGFTPGMGATYILEHRLGRTLAHEMLLTGRSYPGAELSRRGAGVTVLPSAQVLPAALDLARSIAGHPAVASGALKAEFAGRVRAELPGIIDREVRMHREVLGEESLDRIHARHHTREESGAAPAAPEPRRADPPAAGPLPQAPEPVDSAEVEQAVREALGALLYLEPKELDTALTFNEMGLDSVGAVEVVRDLNQRYGLDLDSVAVYDHPTVPDLTGLVATALDEQRSLHAAATAPTAPQHPATARSAASAAAPLPPRELPDPRPDTRSPAPRRVPPEADLPAPAPAAGPSGPLVTLAPLGRGIREPEGDPPVPAVASAGPEVSAHPAPAPASDGRIPHGPASDSRTVTDRTSDGRTVAGGTPGGQTPADRPEPTGSPEATEPTGSSDIAVIGMSGRFPGADDLDAFWHNLAGGRSDIGEIPVERFDCEPDFDARRGAEGKTYSRWAAMLARVDEFDPAFFHLSPLEARAMDPQQRLFLQESYRALEDAGYAGDGGERAFGVFAGCATNDYTQLLTDSGSRDSGQAFLGNAPSILAARIAYFLNLTGPTLAVDTACSSSLVAVHLACESIRRGECTAALAGGVAVMVTPELLIRTSQTGMLSPTGRSAPFDADADGIVLGEGVGVVVLKRLDAALADGDQVHAVIRAGGINGDGKTNGITAPSAASQAALIRSVLRRAGLGAEDIGYVEAHGTGTPLGDPIEVKALTEAFRADTDRTGFCGLGSVKANIGHTTTAAGIASLLKVLLSLRHRRLAPMPGFGRPNDKIDFAGSPFFPVTEPTDWQPSARGERIAAVSSFGFSGTNSHLLVAEAPARPRAPRPHTAERVVIPVSARTDAALDASLSRLATHLDTAPDVALPDLARTLSTGRRHLRARAVFTVDSVDRLRHALRLAASGAAGPDHLRGMAPADPAEPSGTLPGDASPDRIAASYLRGERIDWEALHARPGTRRIALPTYPFARERHWPDRAHTDPRDTRTPSWRIGPDDPLVDGHRVSGHPVLPGAAAIAMAVAAAAPGRLRLSSVRWLRPCRISAPRALHVSLAPAGPPARRFTLHDGSGTEYATCLAEPLPAGTSAEHLDIDAAARRCDRSVDAARLYADFAAAGVGYGPRYRLLDGVRFGTDEAVATLDPTPAGPAGPYSLHPAVLDAALQTAAVLLPGDRPAVPFSAQEVWVNGPLPAGPLTVHALRERHGFTVRLADARGTVHLKVTGFSLRPIAAPAADPLDGMIHIPRWQPEPLPDSVTPTGADRTAVLHLGGPDELSRALVARCPGRDTVLLRADADGVPSLPGPEECDDLYVVACQEPDEGTAPTVLNALTALTASRQAHRPLRLTLVVAGEDDTDPAARLPHAAEAQGLCRAVAAEYPHWSVRCLDIGTCADDPAELARRILAEPGEDRLVALRGAERYVQRLVPADLTAETTDPYRDGGVYVVAGGTGGIGRQLCRHLAATRRARLAVVGRRPADDPAVRSLLDEVTALGGRARYFSADLADAAALRSAVAAVRAAWGPVHGAFHSALVLRDRTVANLDRPTLDEVRRPKTDGARNLYEALSDQPLDFLVYFSSAVSFTDSAGQANYAAASMFEDAYATRLRRLGHPVSVINWGYWGGVGVVADERYARRLATLGIGSIEPSEGLAAVSRILSSGLPQALVLRAEPQGLAQFGIGTPAPTARPATATRPPAASGSGTDPRLDSARAAFTALDALARDLVRHAMAGFGGLDRAGRRIPLADLMALTTGTPHHRRLLRAVLEMLARSGALLIDNDDVVPLRTEEPVVPDVTGLLTAHPEMAPHVKLLRTCADALTDVLTGSRAHLEVLFPHGSLSLVEDVYRGQPIADHVNGLLAARVADAVLTGAARPVRVLEIGAGTGGSSAAVLAACAATGQDYAYCYTDISPAFLRHGEAEFGTWDDHVSFRPLDIGRDPAEQGFEPGGQDVVLATNVLHATADIAITLRHAASLLRPGGLLLINEVTRASDYLTVTFGLTPDWWAAEDEQRRLPGAPLLSPGQWRDALTEAGLRQVRAEGAPGIPAPDLEQCLIIAERPPTTPAPATPDSQAPAAPGPEFLAPETLAPGPADRAVTTATTPDYVRKVFAEVLGSRPEDLDDRATFETFGIDSLVTLRIVDRFAQDLGELPATLLFENLTIEQLATHLEREHADRLGVVLRASAPQRPAPASLPTSTSTPESTAARDGDIAVIGVCGRYPGAPDLRSFWQNLASGTTSVTDVPADRWDWRTHFDARRGTPQHTYGRWGGFLEDVDRFDPAFFGILARDAAAIDPQERLFLETVWNLLEETGHLGTHTRVPRTGVFAGLMYGTYGQLGATLWNEGRLSGAHSSYWSVANRVSYFFDFTGPSMAVDSACSSSLTAVHLACESLRRGECETAIAGGVNLILHPSHHVSLSGLNMLSADGATKVFDERADGFVPGEGVGAVLLKPLHRAMADGDDIWAVIKGGSVNAGGKTGGYTVPNPNAQAALITDALRRADVEPGTVSYIEAHGTGTELGDPIEFAALARAFAESGAVPGRCGVSSVKANIGHLEGAAGIAGLTKTLLQLRHRKLAPCASLDSVNPKISLAGTPFFLPRMLTDWEPTAPGTPLRAGISSFGAGGANVHLVLEEPPAPASLPAPTVPVGEQLFLLSARTPGQLATHAARIADFLTGPGTDVRLDALCWTSQTGRRDMAERVAVLAADVPELAARLAAFAHGQDAPGLVRASAGPSAAPPAGTRDLTVLAGHWASGGRPDWRELWPEPPGRIPYPTYPFERTRHWTDTRTTSPTLTPAPAPTPSDAATTEQVEMPSAGTPPGATQYLVPEWRPEHLTGTPRAPGRVLVLGAGSGASEIVAAVEAAIRDAGGTCLITGPGESTEERSAWARALAAEEQLPDGLVYVAGPGTLPEQLDAGLHTVLSLTAVVLAAGSGRRLRVVFGHTQPTPAYAAVSGTLAALALEHGGLRATRLYAGDEPATAADRIVAELLREPAASADTVTYEHGERRRLHMAERVPADGPGLHPAGTYLITGGAGELGLRFAAYVAQWPVTVVLAGRSALDPERTARLAALAGPGARIHYHRADVTSRHEVDELIGTVTRLYGPLRGVLHAAGITRDRRAAEKSRAEIAEVVAPKVYGAVHLDEATRDEPLDHFVLFSSVAGVSGNLGQADYAFANAYLDAFAEEREGRRRAGERPGRTLAIGWPLWDGGGMSVDAVTRRLFERLWGMVPMPPEAGLRAFTRALTLPDSRVMVVERAAPAADSAPQRETATVTEALPDVERTVRTLAAAFLLVDEREVDTDADLMELGFDSLSLTELVIQVNEAYGLDLLPTVLFENPTLGLFARYLVEEHGAGPDATPLTGSDTAREDTRPEIASAGIAGAGLADTEATETDAADTGITDRGIAVTDLTDTDVTDTDIAVIGMAGRMPGADDPDAFFRRLIAGDDLTGPVPEDRADLRGDPEIAAQRGGFLADIDRFDAARFRISPREAALMDPQQRLFLETVWSVFEDAGYRPDRLAGTDTGLFVGVATSDYDDLMTSHAIPVQAHMATGIAHSVLANRVSHRFDLHGPSEAVDTACSSSLVALHRAVRALADGECTMAVAGGVNAALSPSLFKAFVRAEMLSPDGRCKTFDAAADGYVRGEGVGAVLLKPLRQAVEDGDHIHAVIKGSAVNHCGRTASLTAPDPEAQARVLVSAYRRAGVDPRTVTYLESHGTGTRLGDPIEIEGMKKAFTELYEEHALPVPATPHVAVGAVKTNIGHLEAASGMAGLLKVLLCLRHGWLPGNLHLGTVNPYLRLDGSPLRLLERAERWEGVPDGDRALRRAGVSSFGFGGSNAHVVVQGYDDARPAEQDQRPRVFPLSAPDGETLHEYAARLADSIGREPSAPLSRVAYTLQTGRTVFRVRHAVVAADRGELLRALAELATGPVPEPSDTPVPEAVPGPGDPHALAAAWTAGAQIDWEELWTVVPGRAPLPGVPFTRTAHWFTVPEPDASHTPPPVTAAAASTEPRRVGGRVVLTPAHTPPHAPTGTKDQKRAPSRTRVMARSETPVEDRSKSPVEDQDRTPVEAPGTSSSPAPVTVRTPRTESVPPAVDTVVGRTQQLVACGYNPVLLPAAQVPFDLITDSWAERDHPSVTRRMADITARSFSRRHDIEECGAPWLPFKRIVATPSGRAAEALLCRLWPGERGTVLHDGVFPTWLYSLAGNGFRPVELARPDTPRQPFRSDVDLTALRTALATSPTPVSFVCLEAGNNAGGGHPISWGNLTEVRRTLGGDIPLVIDATRIVENAFRVRSDETDGPDGDVWDAVRDLLATADVVTLSMPKDFGIDSGGLLATNLSELTDRLDGERADHGPQLHAWGRRALAVAANDLDWAADRVAERMRHTATLWEHLHDAGAPLTGPAAGHCVVLDVSRLAPYAELPEPVPSFLATLYRETGVRGGPHLGGGPEAQRVRLAVPVGLTDTETDTVADRVATFLTGPAEPIVLAAADGTADQVRAPQARYRLGTRDSAEARPVPHAHPRPAPAAGTVSNPNLQVLREAAPDVEVRMVPVPGGEAEVFVRGRGPAVLLMPPFNIGAGLFVEQFRGLSDRHQVVAVHRPGVGRTRVSGGLGLEEVSALHRHVLDELGIIGPVHVVGASFGGLQAQSFVLAHPERAAGLTLISSSHRFANRPGGVAKLARVAAEDLDAAIAGSGSRRLADARDDLLATLLRSESMDPHTGMRYLDAFAEHAGTQDRLADISTPTLLIHGRYDTVVPVDTVQLLHRLIRDSELVEISDAGHFPGLTSPGRVNEILTEFFATHRAVQHIGEPTGEPTDGSRP
ncbi:SDR family NAD(P)-dependent oxidoreductase [Streptomyces sp. NPDC057582]|uniref:SDR family NAD(P)-dependent oxidoreductase n=1 Tax=Streptomyces sp. NPDC057582 TaxID=3346174 RepID=UPI0036C1D2D2